MFKFETFWDHVKHGLFGWLDEATWEAIKAVISRVFGDAMNNPEKFGRMMSYLAMQLRRVAPPEVKDIFNRAMRLVEARDPDGHDVLLHRIRMLGGGGVDDIPANKAQNYFLITSVIFWPVSPKDAEWEKAVRLTAQQLLYYAKMPDETWQEWVNIMNIEAAEAQSALNRFRQFVADSTGMTWQDFCARTADFYHEARQTGVDLLGELQTLTHTIRRDAVQPLNTWVDGLNARLDSIPIRW